MAGLIENIELLDMGYNRILGTNLKRDHSFAVTFDPNRQSLRFA
jgi:hypothetical protein